MYVPKHLKEESSRFDKKILRQALIIELILVVLAVYGVIWQSTRNIVQRATNHIYASMSKIDNAKFGAMAADSYKTSQERIVEEEDKMLWTVENVDYRTGPDESYASAGTLEKEKMVMQTGITKNEWSRVTIDDREYYISSAELTDETPLSALFWPGEKGEYQKYALSLFPDYGWSDSELEPLINLWNRESRWNPSSHNRSSGAHGIPQALPGSKMASEGSDWATNGNTQVRWGLKYIRSRYGSPSNAWAHFQRSNWY